MKQEKFCQNFGELELVRTTNVANDHPHVMMITNVTDTGKPTALEDGEMMFHSDTPYYESPLKATLLYAVEIPSHGGNTMFSNSYKAAETLPEDIKHRINTKKALHIYDYGNQHKTANSLSLIHI